MSLCTGIIVIASRHHRHCEQTSSSLRAQRSNPPQKKLLHKKSFLCYTIPTNQKRGKIMKSIISKITVILSLALLFTGCPGVPDPSRIKDDANLTEKIAAAQGSIDFEGAEIAQDAEVSNAITIKNLKLGGKTLTIKASGTELVNVSNAVIIIDQQVGDGDVTLTGCSNITKLVVNGGGSNSIHIKNSKVASVEVKKDAVRVAVEGNSEVEALVVDAAGTKIESDENIVIKSIAVAAGVDAITIKGGNIETIEVLTDAQSGEASEEKPQIIVDGNTQINNIEGTTDVTLTDEAIENGASVNIVSEKPIISFRDETLIFLSDGSVTDPEFENQPYYYEYVFKLTSRDHSIDEYGFKVMIYKLSDDIKVYAYGASEEGFKTQEYPDIIVSGKSVTVPDLYDYILILETASIVKGEFTENRPSNLDDDSFITKALDINDCGMPLELKFPENPYKAQVKVTPSSKGNVIEITTNKASPYI